MIRNLWWRLKLISLQISSISFKSFVKPKRVLTHCAILRCTRAVSARWESVSRRLVNYPQITPISQTRKPGSKGRGQEHAVRNYLIVRAPACCSCLLLLICGPLIAATTLYSQTKQNAEYLWYEAENMRGFATKPTGEPVQNPSWMNLPRAKAPGWGMNGPGVSAEWSQGGESEWNSAAASADESTGKIYQDIEIPRDGNYKVWVRYADWANKTESFVIRITQGDRELLNHEFGTRDVIDSHDEVSMYWGWAFAWDGVEAQLAKGAARISIAIEKPAEARRHIDCVLLTNDLAYVPDGRRKPDFAAMRYLREWARTRAPLSRLLQAGESDPVVPSAWQRPKIAGQDFFMPWNITPEFWKLYDQPAAERPLYPFNAEPIEEFVQKYKGARDVPLFSSKFVVPVIYINNLPEYL